MKTINKNPELSYLSYAFDRLVVKRLTKYYYFELIIIFIGSCLWDKWAVVGSLLIGFGIGLFVANVIAVGLVRERLLLCYGKHLPEGKIEVVMSKTVLRFSQDNPSIKWLILIRDQVEANWAMQNNLNISGIRVSRKNESRKSSYGVEVYDAFAGVG
jgi:hypothetical protein